MTSKDSYDVTELFRQLWQQRFKGFDENIPKIVVEFFPYATLKNTIRRRENTILLRISDMLKDAPREVMRALGMILFCKLERRKVPKKVDVLYRDYVNSTEIRDLLRSLRQERGKKILAGSRGEVYDLQESFDRVNKLYFHGMLKKPELTWSQRKTTTRFGHHDDALNTIVISRTLDDENLPPYILDYIMYHEALHIKHGINYESGRRNVHTRAFKNDEKKFEDYSKAVKWLKKLSDGSVGKE